MKENSRVGEMSDAFEGQFALIDCSFDPFVKRGHWNSGFNPSLTLFPQELYFIQNKPSVKATNTFTIFWPSSFNSDKKMAMEVCVC